MIVKFSCTFSVHQTLWTIEPFIVLSDDCCENESNDRTDGCAPHAPVDADHCERCSRWRWASTVLLPGSLSSNRCRPPERVNNRYCLFTFILSYLFYTFSFHYSLCKHNELPPIHPRRGGRGMRAITHQNYNNPQYYHCIFSCKIQATNNLSGMNYKT